MLKQHTQHLPIPADPPAEPLHEVRAREINYNRQGERRKGDDRRGRRAFAFVGDEQYDLRENRQ